MRRYLFKQKTFRQDYIKFDILRLVFTRNELCLFNPEPFKLDIIEFIKYANSLRTKNLKSLPFSSGQKRTDLYDDVKKVVFYLKKYINEDEI